MPSLGLSDTLIKMNPSGDARSLLGGRMHAAAPRDTRSTWSDRKCRCGRLASQGAGGGPRTKTAQLGIRVAKCDLPRCFR